MLRACPHHHYALDKIGGNRVKAHPFPRGDFPTLTKWNKFVKEHNGSLDDDKSQHFLCSAHFQPDLFEVEGTLSSSAVPTISPEFVRLSALKNGDVSHPKLYPLPERNKKSSRTATPVIFLNNIVEGCNSEKQQLSSVSSEVLRRKRIGDLCACEFVCPVKTKVGLQLINDTLRIWGSVGKSNEKQEVGRESLKGNKVEVVEKCAGKCYNHLHE